MMGQTKSGLMTSLAWHGWNLLRLRGDWKSMPDATSFMGVVLGLVFVGGMAEQFARGRSLMIALGVTVAWLAVLLWASAKEGRINRRLASALGILSLVIQGGLVLASWLPAVEWPIAIWAGIAIMHLLSQASQDGAGAWR
jgi:hypothetical protein